MPVSIPANRTPKMPDRKGATEIDKYVGGRVRMRRIMLDISQDTLGKKLGLTFQQIQKYEKGTNRMGASRLHEISVVLDVPVAFFFQELPGQANRGQGLPQYLVEFMGTIQAQRLAKALGQISDKKMRTQLVTLIESIANNASATERTKGRK
jgi:transcriptional regulator with XRE-family HTH domain